jgi:hypothetical protein
MKQVYNEKKSNLFKVNLVEIVESQFDLLRLMPNTRMGSVRLKEFNNSLIAA